jgi:cardiolipin synthase
MAEIGAARREIWIVSPYLTFPFVGALEQAAARGVAVRLITPLANNKPTVRDYLLWSARRAGFEVRLIPDMIHLKGMLIDQDTLAVGSSNFDFVSFRAEEELLAMVKNRSLIEQFRRDVIAPLLERSVELDHSMGDALSGLRSLALLKTADLLVRTLPYGARSARDWTD